MKSKTLFTKAVSMLLCALMVVGCLPLAALATGFETDAIPICDHENATKTDPTCQSPSVSTCPDCGETWDWEDQIDHDAGTCSLCAIQVALDPANETVVTQTQNAGDVYYMLTGIGGTNVEISGEGLTAVTYTVRGQEVSVDVVEGTATLKSLSGMSITIKVTGSGDISFKAYTPVGTVDNPAALVIGENTATVDAGSWDGYLFNWTATCDGTLVLAMPTDMGWQYTWGNVTTGNQGNMVDSTMTDVAGIAVSAGDELTISVNTFDPDDAWNTPAGTITFTASFEHTITILEAVAPTCTTTGLTEGQTCACGENNVAQKTVDMLAHNYEYTNNGDDHTKTCTVGGESTNEAHAYVDGTCACGATEGPMVDSNLTISYTALNSAAYIGAQFQVPTAAASGYDSVYLVVTHNGSTETLTENIGASNNLFVYEYKMAAKEMTDVITVTPYGVKDGVVYVGVAGLGENWSVRTKAFEMLDRYNKPTSSDKNKKLAVVIANMLQYGEEAQIIFEYNTDDLATTGISETHAALINRDDPVISDTSDVTNNGISATSVYYKALGIESIVNMQIVFRLPQADATLYRVDVEYDGAIYSIDGSEFVAFDSSKPRLHIVLFDKMSTKNVRADVKYTVYAKSTGEAVSETFTYSVESFVYDMVAKESKFSAMVKALMHYGDAANNYYG